MSTPVPEEQPADSKPPKKAKWCWTALSYVFCLWMIGGVNVLLLQDIPLLLFLLIFGFALVYPLNTWLKPRAKPRTLRCLIETLPGMAWVFFVMAVTFALVVFVIPPFSISPETTYLTEPRAKQYY
jgi:hypothetical protein